MDHRFKTAPVTLFTRMQIDSIRLEEFARRYAAAWCSQDPASVAAFFSPNGSLAVNNGNPAVGRHEIAEVARSFMETFPDLQVLMDNVRPLAATQAEFSWTLIGTATGPGGGGNRVRISGFERWQFGDDGLIAASQGQFDSAEYARQLDHGKP